MPNHVKALTLEELLDSELEQRELESLESTVVCILQEMPPEAERRILWLRLCEEFFKSQALLMEMRSELRKAKTLGELA